MAIQLTVIFASGSLVDLDATFFIQLGIFLLMFLILRSLLFKPVVRLIDARHDATVGAMKAAAELQAEAAALTADFQARLQQVRVAATADKDAILDSAKHKERELVSAARKQTQRVIAEMRVRVDTEMKETRKKLEEETRTMASLLAEKVLDRGL